MKIISTYHPEDSVFNGVISALATIEQNTILWMPQHKPAFDMLDEIKPDLLICTSSDFTQELVMALTEYQNINVVVFGLHYPASITPKLLCVNENVPEQILEHIKVPFVQIKPAANVAQYNNGIRSDRYAADVFYLSNSLIEHNSTIIPTLGCVINNGFKTKICGNTPLPFPQYLGKVGIKNATNLIVSSKIVLDFNKSIMLDAAFNRAFCLSNVETNLYPSYSSNLDLHTKIVHFLADEKHKQSYIKKAHKYAKNNTYFHRLNDICKELTLTNLADASMKQLEKIQ